MARSRVEHVSYADLEWTHERLVDAHHGSGIVELAAVVGCGEQRYQLTLGEELIAIFDHLSIAQHKDHPPTHLGPPNSTTVTPSWPDCRIWRSLHYNGSLTLWRLLLPYGYSYKASWVNPSFVIFDIRALWLSALSARVPGCQKLQMMA